MSHLLQILGFGLLALAFCGMAALVAGGVLLGAFAARPAANRLSWPSVTILKPLSGAEPGLAGALESFIAQDYPGEVQLVFGLQDPADPARRVAEGLRQAHPGRRLSVVVDATVHGANRKVSNLINMAPAAGGEVLVLADSDIVAPPDYLRRLVDALERPGVAVVTCPYFGLAEGGLWARLAAMGLTCQFLPHVALGVGLGLAHPCMGSTIALRRTVLAEIGGFAAVADRLADDYALGAAVRARGLRSVVAPLLVAHRCLETSLGDLLAHERRWAFTVRSIDPVGYLGSGVTYPVALAVIANLLLPGAPMALGTLAAAVATRIWLACRAAKVAGAPGGDWWLAAPRDILSFAVFVSSLFVRAVVWRGTRFRVDRRGALTQI